MNPENKLTVFTQAREQRTSNGLRKVGFSLTVSLIGICGFLYCGALYALPTDKEQNTYISADAGKVDRKERTATYTGNVKLTQGTLEITADKVVIQTNPEGKVEQIEAQGAPARYQQKPAEDQNIIKANATQVRYLASEERLVLIENAMVEQEGGVSISGNRIDYDILKEVMKAAGKNQSQQERIEIVIPPQSLNKD